MARTHAQPAELVLDDDSYVPVLIHIPAALYRTLHRYCVYRGSGNEAIPKAATAAVAWYFDRHAAFQAWLSQQPEIAVALPDTAVRPTRKRRKQRPDDSSTAT